MGIVAGIKRCNPLTAISELFAAKLKQERDDARRDTRLKAAVPVLSAELSDA